MKLIKNMGAKFLAIYFVALPLLFGIHIEQHHHENHLTAKHANTTILSEVACEICDLYQNQIAVVSTLIEVPHFTSITAVYLHAITDLNDASKHLRLIRGPPPCL